MMYDRKTEGVYSSSVTVYSSSVMCIDDSVNNQVVNEVENEVVNEVENEVENDIEENEYDEDYNLKISFSFHIYILYLLNIIP